MQDLEHIKKKQINKDQILQMSQQVTQSAKNCRKEYKKVQSIFILIDQYIS